MAEQDVDIADLSDDEIVDLTGDDADWEDVEVQCIFKLAEATQTLAFRRANKVVLLLRISAISKQTWRRPQHRSQDKGEICR